jgi:YYY domain-containing protein
LEELILLGSGLLGTFVRVHNADIIGQEKFMDLAFFNGFLATTDLPAEDPWLAGYGMPYYPFGYLLLGLPAKLAGLPAAYGYNLALVLVFALSFLLSAAVVANLVTLLRFHPIQGLDHASRGQALLSEAGQPPDHVAWGFGLVGALLVAVCGNLVGPLELVAARGLGGLEFWKAVGVKNLEPSMNPAGWLPGDSGWWWHASRVIPTIQPDGITEFPYFSFLLGDLHPHFTALPLLLLIIGLVLALLLEDRPWHEPGCLLLAGLVIGVPLAANTWDVATFWALYGLAALLAGWRLVVAGQRPAWAPFAWALAPIPLGVLLFSPYFLGYASQPLGIGFVGQDGRIAADRTPLISLLIIFGPYLLVVALLGGRLALVGQEWRHGPRVLLAAGLVLALGLAAVGLWTAAFSLSVLVPCLFASVIQAHRWLIGQDPRRVGASALCLVGLAVLALSLLVGVELVYIRDSFGTRMNTVFKFYYHVWLLLALVGGSALALWLTRSAFGVPSRAARGFGGLLLGAVVGLGLVYPLAATWAKSNAVRAPATLDGAAFLERSRPGDAAAIRWLAGLPERPIVLEAVGGDYQEFARVSTFSGLPTVLGWIGHELQWRGQLDEYNRRQQDVDTVYRRADPTEGMRLLDHYRVSYVFVGSLERERYGAQVAQRLERWLTPVFRAEGAVVFAVPGRALAVGESQSAASRTTR